MRGLIEVNTICQPRTEKDVDWLHHTDLPQEFTLNVWKAHRSVVKDPCTCSSAPGFGEVPSPKK